MSAGYCVPPPLHRSLSPILWFNLVKCLIFPHISHVKKINHAWFSEVIFFTKQLSRFSPIINITFIRFPDSCYAPLWYQIGHKTAPREVLSGNLAPLEISSPSHVFVDVYCTKLHITVFSNHLQCNPLGQASLGIALDYRYCLMLVALSTRVLASRASGCLFGHPNP